MKVLMTTDTVGGVFTHTLELIGGLGDRADVVVATMGAPLRNSQRSALLAAGALAVHDRGYVLEWMSEPWADVAAAGEWLLELAAQERPDVVHVNGYAHGALPWDVPCVIVGHSCVLSWWRAVRADAAPPAWHRYRAAVREGLRAADAVVAPTRHMLSELQDLYGRWPGRALVIPNGTSPAMSAAPPLKAPFVLAAGRMWDEAKNLSGLDRAGAGLEWPVLAAGPLSPPSQSVSPVRPRYVWPLGELEPNELAEWRQQAAVFAAPALYEPFGLAVLEAAADRCALVLSDIPSLRELWDGAARFVDPRDHPALHFTLKELIDDPVQRDQLGRLAQQRAERYDAGEMSARYHELYASLSVAADAVVS
jgi:glycogen(starch) synthase